MAYTPRYRKRPACGPNIFFSVKKEKAKRLTDSLLIL
jgi:hypothetical protein